MTGIQPEQCVRLKQDIPNLFLHCGAVGVVKSTWCSEAFEVEFYGEGEEVAIRALVFPRQIEILDTCLQPRMVPIDIQEHSVQSESSPKTRIEEVLNFCAGHPKGPHRSEHE